jgi:hypothetical protein
MAGGNYLVQVGESERPGAAASAVGANARAHADGQLCVAGAGEADRELERVLDFRVYSETGPEQCHAPHLRLLSTSATSW